MRRAANLLATTEQTVEASVGKIGYHNPFVFSHAFAKWTGWMPSDYHRKRPNGRALTNRGGGIR